MVPVYTKHGSLGDVQKSPGLMEGWAAERGSRCRF